MSSQSASGAAQVGAQAGQLRALPRQACRAAWGRQPGGSAERPSFFSTSCGRATRVSRLIAHAYAMPGTLSIGRACRRRSPAPRCSGQSPSAGADGLRRMPYALPSLAIPDLLNGTRDVFQRVSRRHVSHEPRRFRHFHECLTSIEVSLSATHSAGARHGQRRYGYWLRAFCAGAECLAPRASSSPGSTYAAGQLAVPSVFRFTDRPARRTRRSAASHEQAEAYGR